MDKELASYIALSFSAGLSAGLMRPQSYMRGLMVFNICFLFAIVMLNVM